MVYLIVTRVGTNVVGSTVGLVYGGGAFLGGLFDKVLMLKAFLTMISKEV